MTLHSIPLERLSLTSMCVRLSACLHVCDILMQWYTMMNAHNIVPSGTGRHLIAMEDDVVLAEEGGVDLLDYPAVRRWLDRVKQWPRFVVMPGVFPFGTS